jgi:hypothetical protein
MEMEMGSRKLRRWMRMWKKRNGNRTYRRVPIDCVQRKRKFMNSAKGYRPTRS